MTARSKTNLKIVQPEIEQVEVVIQEAAKQAAPMVQRLATHRDRIDLAVKELDYISAARALGATGWYGVLSLLVAILALHLTLAAKYWRAQTTHLSRRAADGRPSGRAARLFTLRYATFTEKLVIILLFASVLVLVALDGWVKAGDQLPAGLGSGSLAGPSNSRLIEESLPPGEATSCSASPPRARVTTTVPLRSTATSATTPMP